MPKEKSQNNNIFLYIFIILVISFFAFIAIKNLKGSDSETEAQGTLILNSDRSQYNLDDTVYLGAVKLTPEGRPSCDSNLKLTITSPSGKENVLSSQNDSLSLSSTCTGDNNVTRSADYRNRFDANEAGTYTILLEDLDTGNYKEIKINTNQNSMFSLKRESAYRLTPSQTDRYPMILKISSKEDFQGKVVDYIPSSFNFIWYGKGKIEETSDYKSISWDVDIKAGEEIELIYEFQAPESNLEIFNIGKLSIFKQNNKIFEEQNYWQVIISQ